MLKTTLSLSLVLLFTITSSLLGCTETPTGIAVEQAYLNDAPPTSPSRAAYMQITNHTTQTQRLVQLNSPQFHMTELHRSQMQDGMMHMDAINELTFAPGQTHRLAPGGLHVMLMRPTDATNNSPESSNTILKLVFMDEQQQPHNMTVILQSKRNP